MLRSKRWKEIWKRRKIWKLWHWAPLRSTTWILESVSRGANDMMFPLRRYIKSFNTVTDLQHLEIYFLSYFFFFLWQIFNKSLLAKFAWAMDVDPEFRFWLGFRCGQFHLTIHHTFTEIERKRELKREEGRNPTKTCKSGFFSLNSKL